jgi:penicillin V acylase-like amidase (Ntn superfamily)
LRRSAPVPECWASPAIPTPPSRFVRALAMTLSAAPQTVRLAEHLLDNFDIPMGLVRPAPHETARFEFTQWSAIADLSRATCRNSTSTRTAALEFPRR